MSTKRAGKTLRRLFVPFAIALVLCLVPVIASAAANTAETAGDMKPLAVDGYNGVRFFDLYNSTFYVYLQPGETLTINLGSQQVYEPNAANPTTLSMYEQGGNLCQFVLKDSVGVNSSNGIQIDLANYKAHPVLTYTVPMNGTGGVYRIEFRGTSLYPTGGANYPPRRTLNMAVTAANGNLITGRIWTDTISLVQGQVKDDFEATDVDHQSLYALSATGYVYKVELSGYWSYASKIQFSAAGLVDSTSHQSLDRSVLMTDTGYAVESANLDKIFFEAPSSDLPASVKTPLQEDALGSAGLGKVIDFTRTTPKLPLSGSSTYLPRTGTISYYLNPNFAGTYYIQIVVNGVTRSIPMTISAGDNHGSAAKPLTWSFDGRDGNGDAIGFLTPFTVGLSLNGGGSSGERVYVVLTDTVKLSGLKITQVNGLGAGNSTVFWDDSALVDTVSGNYPAAVSGTDDIVSAGTQSGVHGWAGNLLSPCQGTWGDDAVVETWLQNAGNAALMQSTEKLIPADNSDTDGDGIPDSVEWGNNPEQPQLNPDGNPDYLVPLKVLFDGNGGTVTNGVTSKNVVFSQVIGALPTATRTDYIFLGWSEDQDSIVPTVDKNTVVDFDNDITLYAVWLYNGSNPITAGNTLTVTKTLATGQKNIAAPGDTVNFTITVGNTSEIADLTNVIVYDVIDGATQQLGGPLTLEPGGQQTFNFAYKVPADSAPNATVTNIAFATCREFPDDTPRASASFTTDDLQVTFDPNGGTLNGVASKKVVAGTPLGAVPTAAKPGGVFLGWSEDKTSTVPTVGPDTIVNYTSNTTLYAVYMPVASAVPSGTGPLTIQKTLTSGQSDSVTPGDTVAYTILVKNTSTTVTLTNVAVVDVINGAATTLGTIDSLAPGASKTFTFQYTVPANTPLGTVITNKSYANCAQYPNAPVESDVDVTVSLLTAEHIWYIRGYTDGTVHPDGNLTRAEAAMAIYRLLNPELKTTVSTTSTFTDVRATDWFGQGISTLTKYGILTGYPDGTFRPNQNITRAEMAAILFRFDNTPAVSIPNPYGDLSSSHWAYSMILYCTSKGWVQGDNFGMFRPESPITRAEFVTAVNRMLDRSILIGDIPSNAPTYTDLSPSHWAYTAIIEASCTHDYTRLSDGINEQWTLIVETGMGQAYNQ